MTALVLAHAGRAAHRPQSPCGGFGSIAEFAGGWPGYNSTGRARRRVGKILQGNGYSTAAFGKWHLTPDDQQGPAGPFDRWPNALGFDYFWGFLGARHGQYDPVVTENNTIPGVQRGRTHYFPDGHGQPHDQLDPRAGRSRPTSRSSSTTPPARATPRTTSRRSGPTSTRASSTRAGTSSARRPLRARRSLGVIPPNRADAADRAVPRLGFVPGPPKPLYARQMEVFAGFQENRSRDRPRRAGDRRPGPIGDNTLILYIWGDNGSSMEGTETGAFNEMTTLNGIASPQDEQLKLIEKYGGIDGWGRPEIAAAFRRRLGLGRQHAVPVGQAGRFALGGTRDPMVISWPKRSGTRAVCASQFVHVTDIVPTLLEAAGVRRRSPGRHRADADARASASADTFDDAKACRHTQQYFEIFGNRAMYKDGWFACRLDRSPGSSTPAPARFAPGQWDPDAILRALRSEKDFTKRMILPPKTPRKSPSSGPVLAGSGALPGAAASRRNGDRLWRRLSQAAGEPARYSISRGAEPVAGRHSTGLNRSFAIEADIEVRATIASLWSAWAPRACWSLRATISAASRSMSCTASRASPIPSSA